MSMTIYEACLASTAYAVTDAWCVPGIYPQPGDEVPCGGDEFLDLGEGLDVWFRARSISSISCNADKWPTRECWHVEDRICACSPDLGFPPRRDRPAWL
jgi:hypothetical protein